MIKKTIRKTSALIAVITLSGCATVAEYQNQCESKHQKLVDVASCLEQATKSDSRMSNAANVKLYVLAAKYLGSQVDEGKLTDMQARLELQNFYVKLKKEEAASDAEYSQRLQQALLGMQAAQSLSQPAAPVIVTPIKTNSTTTCTKFGNTVNCSSY